MGDKLNVGCGQDFPGSGWINIDKVPVNSQVIRWDVDEQPITAQWSDLEEIRCWGNLNEFNHTVVEMMNSFWRALKDGGILDIRVAVVDNGDGCFRDPAAKRYLHSQWAEYFYIGGLWETGGHGLGFIGNFEKVLNEVNGESHHVILKAVKWMI